MRRQGERGRTGRAKGALVERAFRFALWAVRLPRPPSTREIEAYLAGQGVDVNGATVVRWRKAWLKALPGSTPPAATGTTTRTEP